jgi:hypothetical protein
MFSAVLSRPVPSSAANNNGSAVVCRKELHSAEPGPKNAMRGIERTEGEPSAAGKKKVRKLEPEKGSSALLQH